MELLESAQSPGSLWKPCCSVILFCQMQKCVLCAGLVSPIHWAQPCEVTPTDMPILKVKIGYKLVHKAHSCSMNGQERWHRPVP